MKDSFDYLRIAEDCLKQTFAATDDVIRAQWTQLANRWRTLAARIAVHFGGKALSPRSESSSGN